MLVLPPSSSGLYRIAAAMKITGETVRRGPTTMPPSALKWAERHSPAFHPTSVRLSWLAHITLRITSHQKGAGFDF